MFDPEEFKKRLLAMTREQRRRVKRTLLTGYILCLAGIILLVSNVALVLFGIDPSISLMLSLSGLITIVVGAFPIAYTLRISPLSFLRGFGKRQEERKWYKDWRMWTGAIFLGILSSFANDALLAVVSPVLGIIPWPSSWRLQVLYPIVTIGIWFFGWRAYYWAIDKRRKRKMI